MLHSEHPITEVILPPHCHWVTGVMHTQSQIHTLHTNTHHTYKAKGTGTNIRKHKETLIWACGIDTFLPDIPASLCQRVLQLEGHYGWQPVEGKRCGGWTKGRITKWHVTWSNREDLRLIGFHIGSMVLGLQNVRYGSEIRLRL